jgi:type II secretion system protein J
VLAIISTMAYSGLNSVLKSHEILNKQQNSFNQISRIVSQLKKEIRHIVPRPVHDKYSSMIPALRLETANGVIFSFTRAGIPNPSGLQKNSLQRIDYFFSKPLLKKQIWLTMDRNNSEDYKEEIISNELTQFKVEMLGFDGVWYTQWPVNKNEAIDVLPKAIKFSFSTQGSGEVITLVELPL